MTIEAGLILAFTVIALGGAGLAGFVIWLRKRDISENKGHDSLKHI